MVELVDPRTALGEAHQGAARHGTGPGSNARKSDSRSREGRRIVQANQGILVMEAMKMQNEIKSPKNGTVKKIGVTAGSAVNSGDLLAEVE